MSVDATTTVPAPRRLGAAQDVPAAVEVRRRELLRVALGPVDVLVRGEMHDDVGRRARELRLQAAAVAHVAQHVLEAREVRGAAGPAVGGERGLVRVEHRDELGPEGLQQRRERPADRPRAARDEHAPPRQRLLELEHGRHGVAPAGDGLPVEALARDPARRPAPRARGGRQRPRDPPVAGLHGRRAAVVGLVDLRDDVGEQLADARDDGVEIELALVVGQALAEHARRVGDVRDLARGPELLDVAPELQALLALQARRATGRRPRRCGTARRGTCPA